MNRFLTVLGDCHMQARTWANWPVLKGDSSLVLLKAAYGVAQAGHPAILTVGDVLDGNRPSSVDLHCVRHLIDSTSQFFHIPGNHDSVMPSFLDLFPSARMLKTTPSKLTFRDGSVELFGIPYQSTIEAVKEKLFEISTVMENPATTYIAMHQAFKHLLGVGNDDGITAEDVVDILGSDVHIIVGHVHKRHTLNLIGGTGWIHSPGALYPLDWEQARYEPMYSVVDLLTGAINDIPVAVRRYEQLDGTAEGFNLRTALDRIPAPLDLPTAVRVDVALESTMPRELKLSDYPDKLIQFRLGGRDAVAAPAVPEEEIIDLLHAILSEIDATEAVEFVASLKELAEQIYASDDPKGLVNSWLESWQTIRSTTVCS